MEHYNQGYEDGLADGKPPVGYSPEYFGRGFFAALGALVALFLVSLALGLVGLGVYEATTTKAGPTAPKICSEAPNEPGC